MKKILYVGLFGFFGTILRFGIKNINLKYSGPLPINTLIINISGCFALAFVFALTLKLKNFDDQLKLGITTGFIGTYTTFATFCKDIYGLIQKNSYNYVLLYVALSIGMGIMAVILGENTVKMIKVKIKDEDDISDEA
ncbi:fluoride efflux transporter FluC [Clostridium akagii]|uniref:fluoride efflux transporter FluC n=1 Tax=Clostridium akagii TaxID=91623 RepID=UPI00047C4135|nr:CrcB family protein [Clostridium akagii]